MKRFWRNGVVGMGPSADHPIVKELTEIFTSKTLIYI